MTDCWSFVTLAPSPVHLPGQAQQVQLKIMTMRVPEGESPENHAAANGVWPFVYCRPATDGEAALYFEEHPEMRPAEVPSVFLEGA